MISHFFAREATDPHDRSLKKPLEQFLMCLFRSFPYPMHGGMPRHSCWPVDVPFKVLVGLGTRYPLMSRSEMEIEMISSRGKGKTV